MEKDTPRISRRDFVKGSALFVTGLAVGSQWEKINPFNNTELTASTPLHQYPIPHDAIYKNESYDYNEESQEAIDLVKSVIDQYVSTEEAPEFWERWKKGLSNYTDQKNNIRLGKTGLNTITRNGNTPHGISSSFDPAGKNEYSDAYLQIEDEFNPLGDPLYINRSVIIDLDPEKLDPVAYSKIINLPFSEQHILFQKLIGKHFKEPFTQFLGIWNSHTNGGHRSFINEQGHQMFEQYNLHVNENNEYTPRIILGIDYPIPHYRVSQEYMQRATDMVNRQNSK